MNRLREKIENRESGLILYGLTPPRADNDDEKNRRISERRLSRISQVNIDGVVLYDIQDEPGRSGDPRPFPFMPTIDPYIYRRTFFSELDLPAVIYQCAGNFSREALAERMESLESECVVLVGSSSGHSGVKCRLSEAYGIAGGSGRPFLGGVTIPERHVKYGDEHERLLSKQDRGVRFFISQFIFNIEKAKNMISDYYYLCRDKGIDPCPVFFTITPCGSERTVNLLEWLGVGIPRWIKNELRESASPLELSMELCMNGITDIASFCMQKKIPFGCNVESVSVRKDEVLASFDLVRRVESLFSKMGLR